MSLADFAGTAFRLTPSDSESARFGLQISRLVLPGSAEVLPGELSRALDDADSDVVIARYPGDRLDAPALLAVPGYRALPAGALLYWEGRLDRVRTPERRSDVRVDPIGADDAELVAGLIVSIFDGYLNHYAVNPLFDAGAVGTGYAEWAVATALSAESRSAVLRVGGEPVGIATVNAGQTLWEIELAGIDPAHQAGGLYAHLLDGLHRDAGAAGVDRLIISTQVHNTRVQRAWARAGYEPVAAIETVHLVRASLLDGR